MNDLYTFMFLSNIFYWIIAILVVRFQDNIKSLELRILELENEIQRINENDKL